MPADTEEERAARAAITTFRATGFGYFLEQATRPQTIGYALLDSPVALAAWMLDHDTDSYYKIARAFVDGQPSGNLTRDHILDNVTLYWLTGTGASAARSYWESGQAQAQRGRPGSSAGHAPGRLHHVPRRDLADPAQLGREGVPQRHLLQRGRQGRPLRRVGRAGALLHRDPGRVQVTALDRLPIEKGERHELTVNAHPRRPRLRLRAPNLPAGSPTRSPAATSTPARCACTRSSAATARRCC